jgi:hypothetical protein
MLYNTPEPQVTVLQLRGMTYDLGSKLPTGEGKWTSLFALCVMALLISNLNHA